MKIIPTFIAIGMASVALLASKPVLPDILNPHKVTKPSHHIYHRYGPTIQIGILLDTSGSMQGLIEQAKDQLWMIVNEVAKANRYHRDVRIEVGLFEYGKSSIPRYKGYLRMLSPLTTDLDRVSEALFRLRTNGGEEYAGRVILESVERFRWSHRRDDLKILIIAGNESFAQGDVPYRAAIREARREGIIVNTIFCGNRRDGRRLYWSDGARVGGGKYFNIDHNYRRVDIPTPYDDEIIALGKQLNKTYLSYGKESVRKAKTANVYKQDANSRALSKTSYVERNLVKSKKQYRSASSDLVSAYAKDSRILQKISSDRLPDRLHGKSRQEIKRIIEEKKIKREKLQKRIRKLESKRAAHIAKKRKKGEKNLGAAIIKTIKEQAKTHGYSFEKQ